MVRVRSYSLKPNTISVVLVKGKKHGLGFLVKERFTKPHVFVSDIVKGGPAFQSDLIRVGDVVLAVNQTDLSDLPYQDALQALRDVPINATASLVIRGPNGFVTNLQTTFTGDGRQRTVRVTTPNTDTLPSPSLLKKPLRSRLNQLSNNREEKIIKPIPPYVKEQTKKQDSNHNSTTTDTHSLLGEITNENETVLSAPVDASDEKLLENGGKTTKNIHISLTPEKITDIKPSDKNQTSVLDLEAEGLKETKAEMSNGMVAMQCPITGAALQPEKPFSNLKNWETDRMVRDTLHLKTTLPTPCSYSQCKGSMMNPPNLSNDPRAKIEASDVRRLAKGFIDEYYESMKRLNSDAHTQRLEEAMASIDSTGTYAHNKNELIFGAKMAWRNAPRCVGRIQWNKLQVFDYRHVTSTAEMFEAILIHIKYATNKGNIRSCITFFPPRLNVETECRVWNNQLIRYAAFRQPDGSIMGDPVNLEFTELCERLGWKPKKKDRFVVLPLLLQINGQDPDLFELPENLVLEVPLRHPEYDWFEKLGLKWYGVPAVSGMMVDIGGVQYAGCPFNGWFMGTEIARDLCDVQRYNMLPLIGEKMGLNTKNTASLWKDKALVEFNFAVLHSYQTDNVTIMDHHVATESFMKHFSNELRLRGGCPGDWVWLVPPISGSSTPIFHQEILNYVLNPTCFYQTEPWKYYEWKEEELQVKKTKKIHFKELAKSVLLTSSMMTKAMALRVKATILYASETGKSLSYATTLQEIFNHAFDAKVVLMDEYDIFQLEYESLVLVVTSTFGNGDPPENGESLAQGLQKLVRQEKDTDSPKKSFKCANNVNPLKRRQSAKLLRDESFAEMQGLLANVKFSVFGLGSRAYPNYCAFAHAVDSLLGDLEGERLLEIGEGDELCGQEESFRKWARTVFKAACENFCVGEDVNMDDADASLSSSTFDKSKHRVSVLPPEDNIVDDYIAGINKIRKKEISTCSMLKRTNLQKEGTGRSTILVELDTKGKEKLNFQPGDHIGIFPCNDPKLVQELLVRIDDVPEQNTITQLEFLKEKKTILGTFKTWEADSRLPPCSMWVALSRYLDITTPPTPQFLKLLSDSAVNQEEQNKLLELSEGTQAYEDWKFFHTPNLVEVLEQFPSVKLQTAVVLKQLPLLQCRYYSISSSPAVHPGQIHITVSVVNYQTRDGEGKLHHGVCSTYLDRIDENERIACFVRSAKSFHLPQDPTLPCLLVGPGTGIAPFRSFWQQRVFEAQDDENTNREMALVFGCRHPDHDHLYKEEVLEAKAKGGLNHCYTAFSRNPGSPKQYVQNILYEQMSDYVYDSICTKSGHFYVCGDVTMADDVNRVLRTILKEKGDMSTEDADEYVHQMKMTERYHEDIFGVTLRTSEVNKKVRKKSRINSETEN